MNDTFKTYVAEFLGTATLVLIGCGAATVGGFGGELPLGGLAIAFAFGLAVMAMAYGIGPISGCHINPAVTIGMVAAGRMGFGQAIGYIVAQVAGGIVGALVLWLILSGQTAGYDVATNGLGQNGYGEASPGGYGLTSAIVVEIVGTFIFVVVILGVTQASAGAARIAGLIIGLTLTVIHITFIQVTGVSVNPARSIGPGLFAGATAIAQLWVFIVMPIIGGLIAGWMFSSGLLAAKDEG